MTEDSRAAFDALFARCAGPVCAVAYAATRDRGRSEDVARRALVSSARRGETRVVRIAHLARELAARPEERVPDRASGGPWWTAREVATALAELPAADREALVVSVRAGASERDWIEALGWSPTITGARAERARLRLGDRLAAVEADLARTSPGGTFAMSCVAAWRTRSVDPVPDLPRRSRVRFTPAVVVAVVAAFAIERIRARGGGNERGPADATHASVPAIAIVPVSDAAIAPRPDGGIADTLVDFDLGEAPVDQIIPWLAKETDVPILVDGVDLSYRVPARFTGKFLGDILDDVLAPSGARRVEVAAWRVADAGSAAFPPGGERVDLRVTRAPLADVVDTIAHHLHVPILVPIGDTHEVTIDIHAPAGEALALVLTRAHVGIEPTRGYLVRRR
jgi:DNA-directed RNA polymerase specialized sigma24 family protein